MTKSNDQADQGRQLLEAVALHYAEQHGLRPDSVAWSDLGYEWSMHVNTEKHTVRVGFSLDEIEFFAAGSSAENKGTKIKIRNAFASLSM